MFFKNAYFVKIIVSLALSLVISTLIVYLFFPANSVYPTFSIFKEYIQNSSSKITQLIRPFSSPSSFMSVLTIKTKPSPIPMPTAVASPFVTPTPTPEIISDIEADPINQDDIDSPLIVEEEAEVSEEKPDTPLATPSNTPVPTGFVRYFPTLAKKTPTPTRLPPSPTKKPSPIPSPTIRPNPTPDPLKQPWYGPRCGLCYTTARFVQIYANGASTDNCYKNVEVAVRSQMTSVTLLGKTVSVHKKAYPAFKTVASILDKYKKGSSYIFPSKSNKPYAIETVWGFVFRCNVNASTSGRNDLCSSGCVLSPHSFGIAVDINSATNPNGSTKTDLPQELISAFEQNGFRWGGNYPKIGSYPDPMHFEYMKELCEGI